MQMLGFLFDMRGFLDTKFLECAKMLAFKVMPNERLQREWVCILVEYRLIMIVVYVDLFNVRQAGEHEWKSEGGGGVM